MAQYNSVEELTAQLTGLTNLITESENIPNSEPKETFTQRVFDFQRIIQQYTRKVNPKIAERRAQLPIYQKKRELLQVS